MRGSVQRLLECLPVALSSFHLAESGRDPLQGAGQITRLWWFVRIIHLGPLQKKYPRNLTYSEDMKFILEHDNYSGIKRQGFDGHQGEKGKRTVAESGRVTLSLLVVRDK